MPDPRSAWIASVTIAVVGVLLFTAVLAYHGTWDAPVVVRITTVTVSTAWLDPTGSVGYFLPELGGSCQNLSGTFTDDPEIGCSFGFTHALQIPPGGGGGMWTGFGRVTVNPPFTLQPSHATAYPCNGCAVFLTILILPDASGSYALHWNVQMSLTPAG
jgi:hypothetical protein